MKKQLIDIIIKKIEKEYKNDIELLVRYDIKSKSVENNPGLNLYFIPKTEKANQLSFQFIIDGIGYDLFPMKWDRLLKVAAMDSPQAYLFKEAEILYVGDEEAFFRFNQLKEALDDVLDGKYGEALLNKAYEYLNESYIYLSNIQSRCKTVLDVKIEASKLLKQIANVIAFVNHDYYLGGNGSFVSIINLNQ